MFLEMITFLLECTEVCAVFWAVRLLGVLLGFYWEPQGINNSFRSVYHVVSHQPYKNQKLFEQLLLFESESSAVIGAAVTLLRAWTLEYIKLLQGQVPILFRTL